MTFKKSLLVMAAAMTVAAVPVAAHNPMVGGAAMYSTKNIVQNAVNSKDHTTLVAAVIMSCPGESPPGRSPAWRSAIAAPRR